MIVLGIGALIYLFGKAMCGDDPMGKYLSPDAKHEVVYYVRDCGATTGFVDHVEIDGTKILISEAYDGKYPALSVNWISNGEVSIRVSTSTTAIRIYGKPLDHYRSVKISFDPKIIESYNEYQRRMEVQ